MKLTIAAICLLAMTAVNAMPVADHEAPSAAPASVVPLEKSSTDDKPVAVAIEEPVKATESVVQQPNEQLRAVPAEEAEKKEVQPKKAEEAIMKLDEKKPELEPMKPELEPATLAEPTPAAPAFMEMKPELKSAQVEKHEHDIKAHEHVAEVQKLDESSVPTAAAKEASASVAEVQPIAPVAPAATVVPSGASEVAVEPTIQAKKIDAVVEKKTSESSVALVEEKPERVIREAEEAAAAAAKAESSGKTIEIEKQPAVKSESVVAPTVDSVAATSLAEEKPVHAEPAQVEPIAAEKSAKVEQTIAAEESKEIVSPTLKSAESEIHHETPVSVPAASEIADSSPVVKSVSPVESSVDPIQQVHEVSKEQRSQDAATVMANIDNSPVEAVKSVAPVEHQVATSIEQSTGGVVAASQIEEQKIVPAAEKSVKSDHEESKVAEKLPEPEQVHETEVKSAAATVVPVAPTTAVEIEKTIKHPEEHSKSAEHEVASVKKVSESSSEEKDSSSSSEEKVIAKETSSEEQIKSVEKEIQSIGSKSAITEEVAPVAAATAAAVAEQQPAAAAVEAKVASPSS